MSLANRNKQYEPRGDKRIGVEMFGVVLWRDASENRAVIWCEDHGDLAFFKGTKEPPLEMINVSQGDLVKFELVVENDTRFAKKPTLVAADEYPTLVSELKVAQAGSAFATKSNEPSGPVNQAAKVVRFPLVTSRLPDCDDEQEVEAV